HDENSSQQSAPQAPFHFSQDYRVERKTAKAIRAGSMFIITSLPKHTLRTRQQQAVEAAPGAAEEGPQREEGEAQEARRSAAQLQAGRSPRTLRTWTRTAR